ncbi:carbonic anhydrase [Streptomyces sp. CA-142005]|uniref:carbonic anhydrase n=1 Tax=Streptomyces sp. CA-142005 TaxID=3240052 RepID=UPI003D8DEA21
MQTLIEHARTFPAKAADGGHDLARLAGGQQPQVLFIACSDSRVMPALFTGARPGEIFELRTVGNIVPPYRPQAACAVAGTIEFALTALKVPDIVVCGHSHCGAVKGLMDERSVRTMPQVSRWLTLAGHHRADNEPQWYREPGADPVEAAQRHLLTQLGHLRDHPAVARRLAAGTLRLHAWYYTVETGEVLACPDDSQTFRPL